jgi:hypothetical protein
MKKMIYNYPKSSFLSAEKDMGLIVDMIMKNERLKKMLHYTTRDCLSKPNLSQEESAELFGKNIKIVPKLQIDGSVLNYMIISFDNFTGNRTNPEFRDNIIEFDIICHFDQWHMKDFELRPYKIAAELDSMLDGKHLTGIGEVEFLGANQMILTDEFAGLCVMYQVIHGEEDKQKMPNPMDEEEFIENFDAIYNPHRA